VLLELFPMPVRALALLALLEHSLVLLGQTTVQHVRLELFLPLLDLQFALNVLLEPIQIREQAVALLVQLERIKVHLGRALVKIVQLEHLNLALGPPFAKVVELEPTKM
jgi:hypothetical protein